MEVLCKEYQRCQYKNICGHSKAHELINNAYWTTGNNFPTQGVCILENIIDTPCHCSSKFLRKDKLKKLNNEN